MMSQIGEEIVGGHSAQIELVRIFVNGHSAIVCGCLAGGSDRFTCLRLEF